MIKIDFPLAIALYLSFFLLLVFLQWIFYNFYRNDEVDFQTGYIFKCPFCTYVFVNYSKGQYKVCPRCHSWISLPEDSNKKGKKHVDS